MRTPIFNSHRPQRDGVSVIEVLFAMGVVVIGLLGIASLIPLSSKNAADSMQFAEAQAYSNDWYSEFSARGLNVSGNWILYRDFGTPGRQAFSKQLGAAGNLPDRGCTPASTSGMLRELGRESVCLDPYFLAHNTVERPQTSYWTTAVAGTQSNWYRPAVFPYYQDTYNPLVDSAYPQASSGALAWDSQPRMVRVSVPGFTGAPVSMRTLEQTFLSTDDLAVTLDVPALNVDDKDKTNPPIRVGMSNNRFASTNHYSWFATMSPAEPIPALSTESTNFYTVSLAVVHNREIVVYDPAIVAPRVSGLPPRLEEKPKGERLMYVEPVSGNFVGGNGGRVRLIGNDGEDDRLHIGDWVMLSRTYAAVQVQASPVRIRPFTVYRWYRIISVEQEVEPGLLSTPMSPLQRGSLAQVSSSGSTTDPFGHTIPDQVWGREVVLEGPDWNFSPTITVVGSGGTVLTTPTSATMVTGVKAVIERVVTVY